MDTSLAAVLGRIPSGLFVVTARKGESETGMLASWVIQAGFDPPMITVAVRQDRYTAQWLSEGQPFVLNVLSQQQKALIGHFGKGFAPDEPAFENIPLERSHQGLPVILGALGHLECLPVSHLDSGDHRIFLAQVSDGCLQNQSDPMVHIRKSGMHY